jgi:DNA-binding SARP family transcriptional activator/tetratricopeptide (TPR) repeat protein
MLDLLAALLVAPNEIVPTETLTRTVWYDRELGHPRAALHNSIARLRRILGTDLIETLPGGYRLRSSPGRLDLLRFEKLLATADAAASPADAVTALDDALGLWRGKPLGNVESPVLAETTAGRLTERYVSACERWAGPCLDTGRHDAVVTRLASLVEAHPFREQLAAHFILALYRCGRQTEALAAYDTLRRRLSDEMGMEPGAALQDLYLKIVRADPSLLGDKPAQDDELPLPLAGMPSIPRQLPPDLPDFCGREKEMRELAGQDTGVVVISGPGGIGKTALAVHAAHRLAGTFGDGQLFADLSGGSEAPARPAELLASFLRALGVPGQAMPLELSDRAAMYRSLTAERRLLIVLDNAADEGQVRCLLPASAGCVVIVTSRSRMTGLPGTRSVSVKVLDDAHSFELLARVIGRSRAAAEAEDARAVAALCGGLPLALRIAGARLAARTHWPVAKLAGRLADARRGLDELVHGDLDVRATFALSYRALDDSAKAMLRRVSLLCTPDFPVSAVAALLDIGVGDAEDVCERLVDAQLLDAAPRPGGAEPRYRMHDLVRVFARELAITDEPPDTRKAALVRVFGSLLELAVRAHCEGLAEESLRLFTEIGDVHGCAIARYRITVRHVRSGRPEPALAEGRQALRDTRACGDRYLEAGVLRELAAAHIQRGEYEPALDYLTRSLEIRDMVGGTARGKAMSLHMLGELHRGRGDVRAAEDTLREALGLVQTVGDVVGQAYLLLALGETLVVAGRGTEAEQALRAALTIARRTGQRIVAARVLLVLGTLTAARRPDAARGYLSESLDIFGELALPQGQREASEALRGLDENEYRAGSA